MIRWRIYQLDLYTGKDRLINTASTEREALQIAQHLANTKKINCWVTAGNNSRSKGELIKPEFRKADLNNGTNL